MTPDTFDLFELLLLLWMGHFVADFVLQNEWMAREKNPYRPTLTRFWMWVLTAHASTHALAVYLVLGSIWLALAEFGAHAYIDLGKCKGLYGIHTDQWLHLGCKLAWVLIWAWTVASLPVVTAT